MTTSIDERSRDLVAHAYDKAPAIKTLMDDAGVAPADVQSAADLAKIPVTRKDALVEMHQANPPFGGFLTVDPSTLPRIYISPGPIFDPQPPNPDAGEGTLAAFKYVGFGPGDRTLNTFMYHLTPAGLLIDEGLRAVGATVVPTGPGNTEMQIMMINALQVSGFVGTPSYLMTILDELDKAGIPKDKVPLKKALFTAEPYTPSQQARFEGEYGMKTTSAYGTADLGFVGYTRHDIQGFCVVDTIYLQICNPDTGEVLPAGETGEIVATTFNKAYPLLRFGTGDLGALAPEPQCDGNQQLLGLFGRSGDASRVRGMFLHPNQLMAAKMQFPQIKNLQAVITRPENKDHVLIRLELKEGAEAGDLPEKLKALAQQAARLRIDEVEIVETGGINTAERTVQDQRTWE